MKKLLLFVCLSAFSISFSQSKKTSLLLEKIKNSVAMEPGILHEENSLEFRKGILEGYKCLIKNYNYDTSKDSYFLTRKEFKKKFKDDSTSKIEKQALTYYMMMDYQYREYIINKYPKCFSKEDLELK